MLEFAISEYVISFKTQVLTLKPAKEKNAHYIFFYTMLSSTFNYLFLFVEAIVFPSPPE